MKMKFLAAAVAAMALSLTGCLEVTDSCSVSTVNNQNVYLNAEIDDYTVDGVYGIDYYGAYGTLTYTYPTTSDAASACADAYRMYSNVVCDAFSVTITLDFPYAYTINDLRAEANAQCDVLL